jgi:phosphoribosylaminoimidazolecarboxamide formyltransferase / IMP cyclohydrolase
MFQYSLVSVSDKTGLIEFIKPLVEQGLKVVSTGGTAEFLKKHGVSVIPVHEVTGFPEVMDGRVRTLNPRIHMSLLARQYDKGDMALLKEHKLQPFDLVVGNLYPFESALKENLDARELMEYIDIGGPCLLRAAAKSYETITVVCDPMDYQSILENNYDRKRLAAKVFAHVSAYDSMIARELGNGTGKDFSLGGKIVEELRYGENPQQKAFWYRNPGISGGLHEAEVLQGKQLSYNNIVDLEAASRTLIEFEGPCMVGVKHANPCGVGIGETALEAAKKCVGSDPVSIFGGIIAVNKTVDGDIARLLENIFLECIVAPEFDKDALTIFGKKKNLRLLKWKNISEKANALEIKTIRGGFLVQSPDDIGGWNEEWKVIGEQPNAEMRNNLMFAWRVCAHLKSNAIAIAGNGQTLGLGMGQVNRVDAVEHAIQRKSSHHKDFRGEAVLASDAFFPFADSIDKINGAGIRWVIQPGGSVRDDEVIARAKECGINMVLTGVRHFYH